MCRFQLKVKSSERSFLDFFSLAFLLLMIGKGLPQDLLIKNPDSFSCLLQTLMFGKSKKVRLISATLHMPFELLFQVCFLKEKKSIFCRCSNRKQSSNLASNSTFYTCTSNFCLLSCSNFFLYIFEFFSFIF